jgi:hypothetical protein
MTYAYVKTPFAVSGQQTAIPDAIQPGGQVSFNEGYGINYERDLDTDPLALPVPRREDNYLLNLMTSVLQQYQQTSAPLFITSADNGGVPFPYEIDARVRYNPGSGMRTYRSLVNSNTALPTVVANWGLDSAAGSGTSTTITVTQAGHGLTGIKPVKLVAALYSLAEANTAANAEFAGFAEVVDPNTLKITVAGLQTGFVGLSPGVVYYLDPAVSGGITTVDPVIASVPGTVSRPVLLANTATTGFVLGMRGVELGTTSSQVNEATVPEMIAGTAADKYVSPRRFAASHQVLSFFAVWDGAAAATILNSFNVTSITDNGVGLATVNFTTALPTSNYAYAGSAVRAAEVTVTAQVNPTASSIQVRTSGGGGSTGDFPRTTIMGAA